MGVTWKAEVLGADAAVLSAVAENPFTMSGLTDGWLKVAANVAGTGLTYLHVYVTRTYASAASLRDATSSYINSDPTGKPAAAPFHALAGNAREFDINTTIQWDSTSGARNVLYLELVAPYRWQVYKFPKGVYAGEDLMWTITGNEELIEYSCLRHSDGGFVDLVAGWCTGHYHTQFICRPTDHMRFYYATHNSSRMGGYHNSSFTQNFFHWILFWLYRQLHRELGWHLEPYASCSVHPIGYAALLLCRLRDGVERGSDDAHFRGETWWVGTTCWGPLLHTRAGSLR